MQDRLFVCLIAFILNCVLYQFKYEGVIISARDHIYYEKKGYFK